MITGVSFIGAGTILHNRKDPRVRWLTTAASLLLSAAIGIAVALEQYILAVGTTLLVMFVLRGVKWLVRWAGWAYDVETE